MGSYILRRLAMAVPTFIGITLVAFLMIHLAPGDPIAGTEEGRFRALSPDALEKMREVYGLDEPVWKQYGLWLGRLVRLDLGVSLYDGQPVSGKIAARLPATITLGLASTLLAWGIALPLGIGAASRPGSRLDQGSGVLFYSLYSIPIFWAALVLQLLFAVHLRWLPLQGLESDGATVWSAMERLADRAAHLVLPALCLATGQIAFLSRFARAGMIDARSQDYIRTARAKGLPERTVTLRHALANALLPLITLAGFTLPALAGGAVIIERIFSWPGAGRLLFDSIQRRDLTTLMGLTLVGAVLTQAGTLLADILYAVADPRIRYGREEKG
jgi:peptide/nickel transport system permease protein